MADEIARGELQQILPSSVSGSFAISAVWPEAVWVPQKIRVVVDELLARLPQQLAGGENRRILQRQVNPGLRYAGDNDSMMTVTRTRHEPVRNV